MNVDNYGWESSLSMVANEQSRSARQRHGVTLLRPVFMNAVEVGYSYAHCDRDKKLNVRGVTIALWHFICRGHQAIALLPYCFKNYAEKSSRYSELMQLYRLNLIEFTPGYGSEKYAEVNRIMVNRAYETGGCLVARSQMQGITDNKAHLIDVVEQRLLMPTFNGDDIMFPIDGPLGRNGPSLKQTLECEQGSPDWRACSEHQLLLSDQRHWLEKLALLVPEKVSWTRIVQVIQADGENPNAFDPLFGIEPPSPPSPPTTVIGPSDNLFQRTTSATALTARSNSSSSTQVQGTGSGSGAPRSGSGSGSRDSDPPQPSQDPAPLPSTYSSYHSYHHHHPLPNPHQHHQQTRMSPSRRPPHHHHRHYASTRLILRYGPGVHPSDGQWRHRNKHPDATDSVESTASTQSGEDEDMARSLEDEARREEELRVKMEAEQKAKDETLAKLSQIFGYSKSVRVMEKFAGIQTYCLLVEKCMEEADEAGDGFEFADVWKEQVPDSSEPSDQIPQLQEPLPNLQEPLDTPLAPVGSESDSSESSDAPHEVIVDDLIDFSDEPVITNAPVVEPNYSTHGLEDLMF